jgi:hypothetical protein
MLQDPKLENVRAEDIFKVSTLLQARGSLSGSEEKK